MARLDACYSQPQNKDGSNQNGHDSVIVEPYDIPYVSSKEIVGVRGNDQPHGKSDMRVSDRNIHAHHKDYQFEYQVVLPADNHIAQPILCVKIDPKPKEHNQQSQHSAPSQRRR